MGRKAAPQPLALGVSARSADPDSRLGETVPGSARLPPDSASRRSPHSPFRYGPHMAESATPGEPLQPLELQEDQRQMQQTQQHQQQRQQQQPDTAARNPPQPSPRAHSADHKQQQQQQQPLGHRHQRRGDDKASKSGFFFNFGKSSKTPAADRPIVVHQHSSSRADAMSRDSDRPALSKQSTKQSDSSYQDISAPKPNTPLPSRSEVSLASTVDYDSPGNSVSSSSKRSKPKPFNLLGRTRSIKDKDSKDSPSPKDQVPALTLALAPTPAPAKAAELERPYTSAAAPRTAPLQARDRSFRDMMSSTARNHSAERSQSRDMGGRGRDQDGGHRPHQAASYTQTPGGAFFSNLKHSKAAGILNNRFFGGGHSKHESTAPKGPVVDDEHYVLKVINLPLVEQARLTRISKRLEDSRDKTEFWMPAFPWRAIDYLNYKGSEVEGLYRVPGSGPQIKKWQRKFDEELDVDLFEETDLYDINIVGSMLKAWLRELPDELFPKEAQDRVAKECTSTEEVPPVLIEELSNLPPFNYYLLFAITCHLSLLLAHSEKNKMDFRNLCICFQPCMKIDAFCFKFLVCNWRDCWKGCKNEAKYIEEEYALLDQPLPKRSGERKTEIISSSNNVASEEERLEERVASSSDSNVSTNRGAADQKLRLKKKQPAETESAAETSSTISTTLTTSSERETTPRKSGDLRPLSPIKPLSPMNF
ncbi:hypothetical protein C8A05DRAFT_13515 [Staphylotrichum tortipilum]|uniref:Rho-GAP domain-containing protein n=1 Tax=Staphylotrichum tortipilum TaxID=2831512 RepID=A0AAN6MQK3_9PEZI|nr:hypothetical protein C8A05DRAFT_13515 [Staphylotrichum longicolle]